MSCKISECDGCIEAANTNLPDACLVLNEGVLVGVIFNLGAYKYIGFKLPILCQKRVFALKIISLKLVQIWLAGWYIDHSGRLSALLHVVFRGRGPVMGDIGASSAYHSLFCNPLI
ncbi:MAG: hypothetical protein GY814_10335 [Gammaproteobacteria bacterium]|nr:hypothetical protein [Gammaproteobacteria bacterium]